MEKQDKVRHWIDDLPKMGKNSFTQEEVMKQFPTTSVANVRNALYRLSRKGIVQSVWHGFYVIVSPEYGFKGAVPPAEYIDRLMKYLGKEYYVGLLNAAALHGAAHQQPQTFSVVVNTDKLRGKIKKGVKVDFVTKKKIPARYTTQLNTRNGYIKVSTPELTALDLLLYIKSIGGLSRAATVLNELAEVVDFQKVEADFFSCCNAAVIQRLGYILEEVLGYGDLADTLYKKTKEQGMIFRKTPLKAVNKTTNFDGYDINKKWKIIINTEIEIDE